MYKILIETKPTSCFDCPLKNSLTRDCGEIIENKQDSSGMNFRKKPDARCKIRVNKVYRR